MDEKRIEPKPGRRQELKGISDKFYETAKNPSRFRDARRTASAFSLRSVPLNTKTTIYIGPTSAGQKRYCRSLLRGDGGFGSTSN